MKRRMLIFLLAAVAGIVCGTARLAASEPVVENLEYVDADIRDVFRSLGLAGQYNVLLTKDVQGTVTIPFQQRILVKDAIGLIARTYSYDYRWLDDRTVVIGNKDTLEQNFDAKEPPKVFNLRYATPDEVEAALKVVLDTTTELAKNPATNQVTIAASQLQLENAAEIIAAIDRQPAQVNVEMRLEEVNSDSLDDLGFEWSMGAGFSFDASTGSAVAPYGTIKAAVSALETEGKATMLEQPNIICNGSTPGDFFYGSSEPVGTQTTDADGNAQWDIQFYDIGTQLTVEARVNEGDIVTVKVTADVSSSSQTRNIGGSDYPIIEKRTTQSIARLRDGQTLVLAGLTRQEESTDRNGLPVFSRLPLLGLLFGKKEVKTSSKVLCIFMTPRIEAPDLLPGQVQEEDRSAMAQLAIEPVPPEETDTELVQGDSSGGQATGDTGATVALPPDSGTPAAASGGISGEDLQPAGTGETQPITQTTPAPVVAEPIAEAPVTPAAPQPGDLRHLAYTVKEGDTLDSIGDEFGVPWQSIATYSKLGTKPVIRPGQVILVPIPESHKYVVKPKETLWRISKRYGLTVEFLAEINGLTDPSKIEIGQIIVLPCSASDIVNKEY